MSRPPDYGREDIVRAFRELGLTEGDIAFTHASVAMLGRPSVGLNANAIGELMLDSFLEATEGSGTWVLPAYTYSYTNGQPFDPATTPPTNDMGALSLALWGHPAAVRSLDPIFSVIAIGTRAHEIVDGVAPCFGDDCVYARLIATGAAMMNIGIGSHSALVHYVEQHDGVPYRWLKRFEGITVIDSQQHPTAVDYNVRALDDTRHRPYFLRLDRDGRAAGCVRATRLGRGEVNLVRAPAMARMARDGIARDPGYLTRGELPDRHG